MPWIDAVRTALRRTLRGATSAVGPPTAATLASGGRISGPPTSSNGASSMHLRWVFEDASRIRFREVSVVITVVMPPAVDSLYFWALQASFGTSGRTSGAAHMGLQHHPRHPGAGAVNWGGYRLGGGELDGSTSSLPSALANVNTRDYPWRAGAGYRYHIGPSPDRGWRASITDIERNETMVIRDLWSPEPTDELSEIVVWSEVFADCDAPSVHIEWSDPRAVTTDGRTVVPIAMTTNYQRHEDGGCANSTSSGVGPGVIAQVTNTDRVVPTNTSLPVARSS